MRDSGPDKERLLGQSLVFRALDQQARRELASFAHFKSCAAGEVIFNAGSPGHSMMAIAEGVVRVEVATVTGRDIILSELRTGDIFGEIALIDGGLRSATVRAVSNCTLVVLERRSFLDTLQRHPKFSLKLIELLCQRVRRSDERMMELAFLDLPTRLSQLILRLSTALPASEEKPSTKLSVSQSDLAKMIGNTRENVNRCLRKWQEAELIDLKDGWLMLIDRQGLSAVAEKLP